jgi:hypothetical protein
MSRYFDRNNHPHGIGSILDDIGENTIWWGYAKIRIGIFLRVTLPIELEDLQYSHGFSLSSSNTLGCDFGAQKYDPCLL